MASVPNLPIAPAVPMPGAAGTPDAEGTGLDFFAQLLSGGPLTMAIAGQGATPAGEVTLRAAPAEGDTGGADGDTPDGSTSADIIPLLQAQSGFPVAVAPAMPAPAATPAPMPSGAKPTIQTATLEAAPDTQAIKPVASDDMAGSEIVGAAVKALAEKITGKPAARAGKPGAAAAAAQPQDKPAAPAAATAMPRQPESAGIRIEANIQPVSPVHAPIAPQPVSPAAPPAQNAVPDVGQLIAERQLDLANDNQWLDRLARDIARAGAADEPLRFRLHPQTLGHLQVELTQGERGATVRLTVETEAARNILIDAQPRLAAEARAQGVRLAGTEVDLGTANQQGGDARRNAEERPQDIVRVVRGSETAATSSAPAESRSDRYA